MTPPPTRHEQRSDAGDSARTSGCIRVGITELHGMMDEAIRVPPPGVQYEVLRMTRDQSGLIRSPVPCALRRFDDRHVDLVEAVLAPAYTDRPWICSLDSFQAAMALTLLGWPLPKSLRRRYLERLFLRDNFKGMVFWSQAALDSLRSYGGVVNEDILNKAIVVYPAVREVPDVLTAKPGAGLRLLFSGDFFRKGGAHVVDAFEAIQNDFPHATLRICCDEHHDFNTPDRDLRDSYLRKIVSNKRIVFGRVPRETMLNEVLPNTDIYLLPSYDEAFGFALLEAMSYGIPVVATNVFAIPEIVHNDSTGILIDTRHLDLLSFCKGYVVQSIPMRLREEIAALLVRSITRLAASPELRKSMGDRAKERARTQFSFKRRNDEMRPIYERALA